MYSLCTDLYSCVKQSKAVTRACPYHKNESSLNCNQIECNYTNVTTLCNYTLQYIIMFSYSFTGVMLNCNTTIITCDLIHIFTCTGSNSKVYPSTNLLTNMTYLGIMNRPDRAWKCQCGTVMPRLTYLRCTNFIISSLTVKFQLGVKNRNAYFVRHTTYILSGAVSFLL